MRSCAGATYAFGRVILVDVEVFWVYDVRRVSLVLLLMYEEEDVETEVMASCATRGAVRCDVLPSGRAPIGCAG